MLALSNLIDLDFEQLPHHKDLLEEELIEMERPVITGLVS